jgi:hypothetical protein
MRRPVIAEHVEDQRPGRYVRLGQPVVHPKAVYGSQRGNARALYRRINERPTPPARPVTVLQLQPVTVRAHDRIREPLNWGLVVALLGSLAVWGAVVFGLVVAV